MPPRRFSPAEANALLEQVRPLAEALVAHRRALLEARARRGELALRIAGNGASLDPAEVVEIDRRVAAEVAGVARSANAIHALGAVVKDADTGLVDFPALVEGREAYLCWQLGEAEVGFWHGVDEGFGGRKPL